MQRHFSPPCCCAPISGGPTHPRPFGATGHQFRVEHGQPPRHGSEVKKSVAPETKSVARDQLIADEFRQIEIAQGKIGGDIAAQGRTIAHHAVTIEQHDHAIENLQHDVAVADAALFAMVCVVVAVISMVIKRTSSKPSASVPSAEDILDAVLRSTRKRS
jgi:hypothetical protein